MKGSVVLTVVLLINIDIIVPQSKKMKNYCKDSHDNLCRLIIVLAIASML